MTPTAEQPPSSTLPPVTPQRQQPPAEDPETVRLRGEVARHQKEIDQLRSRVTAPPQPAAGNQQPPSQAELQREFYRDPVGYSAAIAQRVVQDQINNVQQGSHETLMRVARDAARAIDPKFFDKYELEVRANVDTVAPQFRTNVAVWENAFKLVRGNHIDEILAERGQTPAPEPARAPAVHVASGDGPAGPSARAASAPAGQELSSEEKHIAKKLHLTEAQYKAGKAAYEGQNDPVSDPVGPSSWDKFVTFSSKDRRRKLAAEREASQRRSA